MLKQLDSHLWIAAQPIRYYLLNLGTRMSVIRLNDGSLMLISPIRIENTLAQQLTQIGEVTHIIAPNCFHYLYAAECKERYPQATFWAAPNLPAKKPDLPIDCTLAPNAESPWPEIQFLHIPAFKTLTPGGFESLGECVFLHKPSRTLILTDLAFNYDQSFPWSTRLVARVLGSYDSLRPSNLENIATRDKTTLKAAIKKLLTWDFDRVIVAHGSIVETGGKHALKEGFERFLGQPLALNIQQSST